MLEVHHSSFVDGEGISKACGCPLLPLKTDIEGPAPVAEEDSIDIVDEAITFYRANVFFKNFDIKSSADKLLIYLTLYINVALKRLEDCRTLAEGTKAIINLGNENVPVPGEKGFPFPWLFSSTKSQKEAGKGKMKDVLYAIGNLYLWLQFFIAVVIVPLSFNLSDLGG
nr:Actin-related protein 2/3 complex subunit 3 [Ipomoea batatas]